MCATEWVSYGCTVMCGTRQSVRVRVRVWAG